MQPCQGGKVSSEGAPLFPPSAYPGSFGVRQGPSQSECSSRYIVPSLVLGLWDRQVRLGHRVGQPQSDDRRIWAVSRGSSAAEPEPRLTSCVVPCFLSYTLTSSDGLSPALALLKAHRCPSSPSSLKASPPPPHGLTNTCRRYRRRRVSRLASLEALADKDRYRSCGEACRARTLRGQGGRLGGC